MQEAELSYKSSIIRQKIINSEVYAKAGLVMCYMDFRNEVKTGGIIRDCLSAGKRVALPLVIDRGGGRQLVPYEIADPENDLIRGSYGILEPCPGLTVAADFKEIDLAIIPGVAFDFQRDRLGYGAGYYDFFLRKLRPDCTKIGIAFDIQMVNKIPAEMHDVKMDAIITESIKI